MNIDLLLSYIDPKGIYKIELSEELIKELDKLFNQPWDQEKAQNTINTTLKYLEIIGNIEILNKNGLFRALDIISEKSFLTCFNKTINKNEDYHDTHAYIFNKFYVAIIFLLNYHDRYDIIKFIPDIYDILKFAKLIKLIIITENKSAKAKYN